ncbi:NAD-dependent succinate-semialdehyde dehydrogenase [Speluncibacter jeojiensis]|uniref:NAD-dependent succinate-semialdehyde dehydrogenase n=1 Tax=Speluncibacter jeojiensis TaxID=2710754 RepID=A0A9X4RJB8_9ACTN|nr:NAD-dependent succinate-semialdehyde dehydrogenase [Corynebacteriales bacterium D3-21]
MTIQTAPIPSTETLSPKHTDLFIDGRWRTARSGAVFDVRDPATGLTLATVSDAGPEDGAAALDCAAAAQHDWARTPARIRAEILRRAYDLLIERTGEFAALITAEMGKPLAESRGEVAYGAEFLRWFSEEAVRIGGSYTHAPDGRSRLLVTKRAVGPSLFITPWNFPLAMATRKIAPALAAGCTSILKPAAQTPLTSLAFAALLAEAGVPGGVVNVIPTTSAGAVTAPLIRDRRLRKLSFTGSTGVGKRLLAQAADGVLRVSMELGGNAPFLVFDDADLAAALDGAMVAKLRNMGQACTAANRFIVHESVVGEFTEQLTARFGSLRLGPGDRDDTDIGPLIDEAARTGVDALVRSAVGAGARLCTGGAIPDGPGHFYPPTVLADVPADAPILREEIFGPVAPIVTFTTESEAIALANATDVGLAGYAYTRDWARIVRLTEEMEVGMLGVNQGLISNPAAPFGGVKESGLGREGGAEGIEEFLDTVYVGIADPR